ALPAYVFSNGNAVGGDLDSVTGILTINSPTAFTIYALSSSEIVVVTLNLDPGGPYSATANHSTIESISTPILPIGTYTYTIEITDVNAGEGYVQEKL
ncbi:hypothetical protein, partial [Zobellia laminariae]|uniref:hypothetical protein n=1 Tax=Zobellia laminariae TaxID=248906 RepID=UPI004057A51B